MPTNTRGIQRRTRLHAYTVEKYLLNFVMNSAIPSTLQVARNKKSRFAMSDNQERISVKHNSVGVNKTSADSNLELFTKLIPLLLSTVEELVTKRSNGYSSQRLPPMKYLCTVQRRKTYYPQLINKLQIKAGKLSALQR